MVNKNLSTHPADMQQHRYSFGDFFLSTHLLGRSSAMLLWSSTLGALLIDPAWLLVVMRLDSYSIFACNELVLVLSVQEIQFGVQRYDVTKCILSVRIRSCDHTCCKMYRLFIGVSFVENMSTKERMIFNSPSRSKQETAEGAGTLPQAISPSLLPTRPVDGSVFIVSDGTKSQMTPN